MVLKEAIFLFLAICLLSFITAQSSKCNQSCGNKLVPYPFGFSSGCQISLNCNSYTQQQLIAGFPIIDINLDHIKISIEATCNRPLNALHHLYSSNYAPTSRNAILLQNCSLPSPCMIPDTKVSTHFESLACSSNSSNISCYSENRIDGFLDYNNVIRTNCKSFLSSISADQNFTESGVLEVQVLELRWWLQGSCSDFCSENAICDEIFSPLNGQPGYSCRCKHKYMGDGYRAGHGCRKASTDCNPARYIFGKCAEATRVAILAAGIAAGASLIICAALFCCCVHQWQSNSKTRNSAKRLLSYAPDINIPIYTYKEIEKATNNFSDKQRLGTGAFGTVYAGKLQNNSWVAIKRIKHIENDYIDQVINEIKLISSVSHPNLVRLLGCSIENCEQILVYEFMPNGTLSQHLQRQRGDGLAWPVRLTIATETAQAIAHLHSAMNPPIYHRDIKSSNILLDYNFRSKVADFGLSRLGMTEISHISTAPQGTPGYVDPQYHQNFHLSDKSDVYSFGVVLIEIITALKVVDFSRHPNEVNLAALATDRISKRRLDEIIDPFLEPNSEFWIFSSILKVAELAFRCLSFHRDMRPTMMEVALELEQIGLSRWASSEGITCAASSEASSCSSSNLSEAVNKKPGLVNTGLTMLEMANVGSVNLMENLKDNSPVSVQNPWLSEQSSPSSSSLLNNNVTR